jgi:hypothetical protein
MPPRERLTGTPEVGNCLYRLNSPSGLNAESRSHLTRTWAGAELFARPPASGLNSGNEVSDYDFPVNVLLRACCNQEVRLTAGGSTDIVTKPDGSKVMFNGFTPSLAGWRKRAHRFQKSARFIR